MKDCRPTTVFAVMLLAALCSYQECASASVTESDVSTGASAGNVTSELELTRQDLEDLKRMVERLNRLFEDRMPGVTSSPPTPPPTTPPMSGGATYVRWGRKSCPAGSEMVYRGYTAGSHHTHKGGASNHLCVPMIPEFANVTSGFQSDGTFLYETEYSSPNRIPNFFNQHQNVPCAVCRSLTRSSVAMIPAKTSCFPGWRVEYFGYLMAGHHDHPGATDYLCVDHEPENVVGGEGAKVTNLLYFVECHCGQSLPCPPFKDGHELACVVCTK